MLIVEKTLMIQESSAINRTDNARHTPFWRFIAVVLYRNHKSVRLAEAWITPKNLNYKDDITEVLYAKKKE